MLANYLKRHLDAFNSIDKLEPNIEAAVNASVDSLKNGGKLIFAGNGGSAADAQHLAAEFVGRFLADRRPLAALALSTDTSALTCIANDYGFDQVFSRQIVALANSLDVFFCISTSGNSENLVSAVKAAKAQGVYVIGLLGRDGGRLGLLCDLNITIDFNITANIQEAHIFVGHVLCSEIETRLVRVD
jgi:D-sedoheptulose 7-phosphate isomerase